MDFESYALLIVATEQFLKSEFASFGSFAVEFKKHYPNFRFSKLKVDLVSKEFVVFRKDSKVYLVVLGSLRTQGLQLFINDIHSESFGLLKVLEPYLSCSVKAIGYSTGACIAAALADLFKGIKAYCFNPVGLGLRCERTSENLNQFKVSAQIPKVKVFKVEGDSLSKEYLNPSLGTKDLLVPWSTHLHPHSLLNFIKQPVSTFKIKSSYFPTINSITFDPQKGLLLVDTETLSDIYMEGEIASVLYSAFESPEELYFTLVPSDKTNPSGPYMRKMVFPEFLKGTSLENALFEADWKLKQLDHGMWFDDLTEQESLISQDIPWFKSGFEFYEEADQKNRFIRLWFSQDTVELDYFYNESGVIVVPKSVKIKVEARTCQRDSTSEYGLVDTSESYCESKFASYVTENFDRLAEVMPELQKLKQIAVLAAVARWIRDNLKVPKEMLNLEALKNKIPKVNDFYEESKVPKLTRKKTFVRENCQVMLSVSGGVSLDTSNTRTNYNQSLFQTLTRKSELLSGFLLSHLDYISCLQTPRLQQTLEGVHWLVRIYDPQMCSEPTCNELVLFEATDLTTDPLHVQRAISLYSANSELYCRAHHPFRCFSSKCRHSGVILENQSYCLVKNSKFHADCVVCARCDVPISKSYVFLDQIYHSECLEKLTEESKTIEPTKPSNKIQQKNSKAKKPIPPF